MSNYASPQAANRLIEALQFDIRDAVAANDWARVIKLTSLLDAELQIALDIKHALGEEEKPAEPKPGWPKEGRITPAKDQDPSLLKRLRVASIKQALDEANGQAVDSTEVAQRLTETGIPTTRQQVAKVKADRTRAATGKKGKAGKATK